MKKKILFFDDDEGRAQRWAADLGQLLSVKREFSIQHVDLRDFQAVMEELNQRRARARVGEQVRVSEWNTFLDEASILVIDFDLLDLNRVAYVTGEGIAYLARCYSRCGLIVALNQYDRSESFDLTLKGHAESFADLNLYESLVHNPGLWREPWKGFRPWRWPLLPQALTAYENRIAEVRSALDKPILSFLGLDKIAQVLPRSTLEFIGTKGQKPETITFRQFVHESQQGLRARDHSANVDSIARIASARIHKWLERLVLSGQDVLVDAPHLVARFPSLLKEKLTAPRTWNEVATLELPSEEVMDTDLIKRFRFKKPNWVSRPGWFWGDLSSYEKIAEVKNPWKTSKKADVVFCEDTSAFVSRDQVKEFVADLPSPFVRRYVSFEDGIDYQPVVRFTL